MTREDGYYAFKIDSQIKNDLLRVEFEGGSNAFDPIEGTETKFML